MVACGNNFTTRSESHSKDVSSITTEYSLSMLISLLLWRNWKTWWNYGFGADFQGFFADFIWVDPFIFWNISKRNSMASYFDDSKKFEILTKFQLILMKSKNSRSSFNFYLLLMSFCLLHLMLLQITSWNDASTLGLW